MNKFIGKYYTSSNIKHTCDFIYTHCSFFEDEKNKYDLNKEIPIDIDLYQFIENDNFNSKKINQTQLNYICHFINKHKSKLRFYLLSGNNVIFFCDKLLKNVSKESKKRFKEYINKQNIENFIFVELYE